MADGAAMAFPAAEGRRLPWEAVPRVVRAAIEAQIGSAVTEARTQPGGFSPGVAVRVQTADGGRAFVKAVCGSPNAMSPDIHRREARVAAALPPGAPVPALRFSYDDGDWVALVFDDVDGAGPQLPWRSDELDRVLDALARLAAVLTPSPVVLETAGELFGDALMRWRELAVDRVDRRALHPSWQRRLGELVELEARWPDAADGPSLVHLDVRADNLLLTEDRVFVVDWPWAAVGAAWLDLAAMLPSVAMQGGPDPESVWDAHPLSRGVHDDALDAFLAGLAGMFTRESLLPPSPGLPTLRAFQAGQGITARAWLARRRGWDDAVGH